MIPFVRLDLLVVALLVSGGSSLSLSAQPAIGTNAAGSSSLATLAWGSSPAGNVAGYLLLFGTTSGVYTSRLDAGNTNSVAIQGLETNVTYYFAVVAYDAAGTQSPPSNEISYSTSTAQAGAPPMDIKFGLPKGVAVLALSFPGSAGQTYRIETSTNLQDWTILWTTNCASDGNIVVHDAANQPARFYRLRQQ